MSRLLLTLIGMALSGVVLAQLNVPNPMLRPTPPTPVTPSGLPVPPPMPQKPGASLPGLPGSDPGVPSSTSSLSAARQITSGMYVATIVNKRAILRSSSGGVAGGMAGAPGGQMGLPSMTGASAQPGAPAATVPVQRMSSFTVRDGEKLFLVDGIEVIAYVTDKRVELFTVKGDERQLAYRGELDSIAPQTAPKMAVADKQTKNREYMDTLSVAEFGFKGGGGAAGSASVSAPSAIK